MVMCSQRAAGSSQVRAAHRRVFTTAPVCPRETATRAGEATAALTFAVSFSTFWLAAFLPEDE